MSPERKVQVATLLSRISAVIAIGVVASTVAVKMFDFGRSIAIAPTSSQRFAHTEDLEKIREELARVSGELARVTKLLNSVPTSDAPSVSDLHMRKLQADLDRTMVRQDKLEAVLLTTPARALEIPLLQRDMEALKTAQATNATAVKDSIDRIYDLNKWLLGGLAISIIGLALANLLAGKKPA